MQNNNNFIIKNYTTFNNNIIMILTYLQKQYVKIIIHVNVIFNTNKLINKLQKNIY